MSSPPPHRRLLRAACAATLVVWPAVGSAQDGVSTGGFHDSVMAAAHRDIVGLPFTASEALRVGDLALSVGAGESTPLAGFTPRFGSLGFAAGLVPTPGRPAGSAGIAVAARTAPSPTASQVVGVEFDWEAGAGLGARVESAIRADGSGFRLGGELAVSGLSVDATFGQEPGFLGLAEGDALTAGLRYDFGRLDARLSYSVAGDATSIDSSMVTVGSQLSLSQGLLLEGDLAYGEAEGGLESTAGRVRLKLNF